MNGYISIRLLGHAIVTRMLCVKINYVKRTKNNESSQSHVRVAVVKSCKYGLERLEQINRLATVTRGCVY